MSLIIQVVIFGLLLFQQSTAPSTLSGSDLAMTLTCVATAIVAHILWRRSSGLFSSSIGLDTVFIPGFLLVNFSLPFLLATDVLNRGDIEWRWGTNTVACRTAAISGCGLVSFFIAFQLLSSRLRFATLRSKIGRQLCTAGISVTAAGLAAAGFLLFGAFLVLDGGKYLSGSYRGVTYANETATDILTVAVPLLVVGTVLAILHAQHSGKYLTLTNFAIFSAIALVLLAMLIHGDRSAVVGSTTPIAGAILHRKRVPVAVLLLGVVVALPIFTILRSARMSRQRGVTAIIEEAGKADLGEASFFAVQQLGGSGLVTLHAVRYADTHGSFRGIYLASGVASLVPFSRRLLYEHVFEVGRHERNSSDLLTYLVNGGFHSGGVGTTTIAESYLDFGLFGVIYNHLILGAIAAYLQANHDSPKLHWRVAYFLALGLFVILPRYGVISPLVRGVLFPITALWVGQRAVAMMGLVSQERAIPQAPYFRERTIS